MQKLDFIKRQALRFYSSGAIAALLRPLVSLSFAGTACAANDDALSFPSKTIQMIVGFAPGGGTDVMARMLAKKFTEAWGQSVVVVNRPGASGNIANNGVAKAGRDGHTLLIAVSSLAINPSLYKDMPYDTVKDLDPVSLLSVSPNIIAAHPSLSVRSVRDLIVLAKSRPGEISYGSPGNGQASHLAMELLSSMAGIKLLHIPYNGGGPSISAALAGQTHLVVGSLPTILPSVRSGSLRAIGITTAQRTSLAPDIPTIAEEADLPDYDANVWYGVLAPANTPRSIINKLNVEIGRVIGQSDVRAQFANLGFEPRHTSPLEFGSLIKSDLAKWEKVIRQSGARID